MASDQSASASSVTVGCAAEHRPRPLKRSGSRATQTRTACLALTWALNDKR